MPTLLSDPSTFTYVFLGMAAAAAGFAWVRTRSRTGLRVFAALAGLVAVVALVDYLVESPREEAVRRVRAMGDAANRKDWPGVFENVSDQFKFRTYTKATFQMVVVRNSPQYNATLNFTGFERDLVEYRPDGTIKLGFIGQADSSVIPTGRGVVYIEAVFGRDPDGAMRLRELEVFEYINRKSSQFIQGL